LGRQNVTFSIPALISILIQMLALVFFAALMVFDIKVPTSHSLVRRHGHIQVPRTLLERIRTWWLAMEHTVEPGGFCDGICWYMIHQNLFFQRLDAVD
jgi:hypothetical protein